MPREHLIAASLCGALGLVAASANAQQAAPENTGCGAGTVLWDGQSGKAAEILAVTTNGLFSNQVFGITSGTLGCEDNGVISAEASQFMSENMEQVAQDAASGGGEALATLASLMEIDQADRAAFYRHAQTHFEQIFPSADVTAREALRNLTATMADSQALSRYAA
ncbi:hypothetical protein CKO13_02135 [Halorhodospira neutriphila]|uniref:DUF3015 domain-containing protein n=1 Tax=Halorhodospira neutriphila TaxID=168379 RepID=A0ABS1E3M8_9GAMM|nr:hypothetical protein [Halorhodospira neutriphila]